MAICRVALLVSLTAGSAARLTFVNHPADDRSIASWRESDYTEVARNFYRESPNVLNPRVDWRGDTPGFVEMEFPFIPWTAAMLYRAVGYHEEILRLLSALLSVAALLVFARLAWRALPMSAAVAGTAVFAANPLSVNLAGSIQPEPLMVLLTVLSVLALWRWQREPSRRWLWVASALAGVAILAKSPAAYLGFLFAYVLLTTRGVRVLRAWETIVAALLATALPLAWYLWAHGLYLQTGLSLGVSNESHFLTLSMLVHPVAWVWGNVKRELTDVFAFAGVGLAGCAFLAPRDTYRLPACWYASAWAFYVIAADTSKDGWAFYYHCISVAPACLLMGVGFAALMSRRASARMHALPTTVAWFLLALTLGMMVSRAVKIRREATDEELRQMYVCMHALKAEVPPNGHIVVGGGTRWDEHGHPVAYNESMAFTWMDRKGFSYAAEDLGADTLNAIYQRGGRYWLVKPGELERAPALAEGLELIGQCQGYRLYALGPIHAPR